MRKPKVFIGSSSEGLRIAESLFACLQQETLPTLWTNELFLPGEYPLETLERQIKQHAFAILVASPDDTVIKRGIASSAMRDNLLVEFGLFAGALGRRRTFFVCPSAPRLDLPSDVLGIITATYDGERVAGSISDRAAAVQVACQQIREVIAVEWENLNREVERRAELIKASEDSQAIQRLHSVAISLRDALLVVQRDAFAAFSDEVAFTQVKERAAQETNKIADSFKADAERIGIVAELAELRDATIAALLALPFPRELSIEESSTREQAIDLGIGALSDFLGGQDPMRRVTKAATDEATARLDSLSKRYSQWWNKYSPRLHEATSKLHDTLFNRMLRLTPEKLELAKES